MNLVEKIVFINSMTISKKSALHCEVQDFS